MSTIDLTVPALGAVLHDKPSYGNLTLHWDERYPLECRVFWVTPDNQDARLIAEQPWIFLRQMLHTVLVDRAKEGDVNLGEGRLHVARQDKQLAFALPVGERDAFAVVIAASDVPPVTAWLEGTYAHRGDDAESVDDWLREAGLA